MKSIVDVTGFIRAVAGCVTSKVRARPCAPLVPFTGHERRARPAELVRVLALSLFGALILLAALPWQAQAQTVEYIHTDALGSIVAVTDQNRNIIERREYEPYGAQLRPVISDGPGYTGHVQDAATGLTYMQQRYYDPMLGKMLSVDPVTAYTSGDMRHFNPYAYAYNNPYKFTDPDGRAPPGCGDGTCRNADDRARIDDGPITPLYPEGALPAVRLVRLASQAREAIRAERDAESPKGSGGDLHAPGDVPDASAIVRGGSGEMPTPGTVFSGSQGGTVTEAAQGVPHGTIRTSTAGEVRSGGGQVQVAPEATRSGQVNGQHVNVTEGGKTSTFSPPQPNPVPKVDRIK